MSEPCRIAVIIPCFNHGEFLPEAVASVVDAKRDDTEVVVVDDGSTDARTQSEMDVLRKKGICVIRQENKGLSAARNTGVRASHGDYIFPLDADDRMRSGWIDRGLRILKENRRVGVVYGDVEFFGTRTGRWEVGTLKVERLLQKNCIVASALYRRAVWQQNGGYDETMVHGFEDWDFWIGAVEHGWHFEYMPEVFFDYRKAEESMLTRASEFEDAVRGFVARKHGGLYREAWLSAIRERESLLEERLSITWTFHHLRKLLKARLRQRFGRA